MSTNKSTKSKSYRTEDLCIACGAYTENGNALHHIKTRGAGGSDDSWNLMPLCQNHHNQVHSLGLTTFTDRYPSVLDWLEINGWELNGLTQKWGHS